MATRTKLEEAVREQAGNLDPAQRELVMSQFDTYKWNKRRIREIESIIDFSTRSSKPLDQKARQALMTERHQLSVDNVSISSKIFMQLKNTGGHEDEFDAFVRGE